MVTKTEISAKFGGEYIATESTFIMGIDIRFTSHIAERFTGLRVIETCTGAGFSTISLARTASSVTTIEIDIRNQKQAISNIAQARLTDKVEFIHGDCMDHDLLNRFGQVDAAYIDPDWAVTGPDHTFKFKSSNTRPPADSLLETYLGITSNVAMILPPAIDKNELATLPDHERESLYMDGRQELYCLYFGDLMRVNGNTEFYV